MFRIKCGIRSSCTLRSRTMLPSRRQHISCRSFLYTVVTFKPCWMLCFHMIPAPCLTLDAQKLVQYAEEAHQLACLHIMQQHSTDIRRFNLHHLQVEYHPGDQAISAESAKGCLKSYSVTPLDLTKCRVSDVNYKALQDGILSPKRRKHQSDVVHIVRLNPYFWW